MPYVIIYAMNVVSLAVIRLFLITFLGFYLYKKKSIKKEVLDFLTSFVINFTIPSLIFSHLIENFLPGQRLSLGFFILFENKKTSHRPHNHIISQNIEKNIIKEFLSLACGKEKKSKVYW